MSSCLHNRDLLSEVQAEHEFAAAAEAEREASAVAAAAAAAVAAAHGPKTPPTPPPAVRPLHPIGAPPAKRMKLSPAESFAVVEVEPHKWDFCAEGVAVTVEEQGVQYWKEKLPQEFLATATLVVGCYWCVGTGHGKLVYKNPETGLLLYWADVPAEQSGWYIASEYHSSASELNKVGEQEPHKLFAWLGNGEQPGKPHMPFWAAKHTPTATSQPAVQYLQSRMHGISNP